MLKQLLKGRIFPDQSDGIHWSQASRSCCLRVRAKAVWESFLKEFFREGALCAKDRARRCIALKGKFFFQAPCAHGRTALASLGRLPQAQCSRFGEEGHLLGGDRRTHLFFTRCSSVGGALPQSRMDLRTRKGAQILRREVRIPGLERRTRWALLIGGRKTPMNQSSQVFCTKHRARRARRRLCIRSVQSAAQRSGSFAIALNHFAHFFLPAWSVDCGGGFLNG